MKKINEIEQSVIEKEYKSAIKGFINYAAFPLIIAILAFLAPIKLVSKTARRMNEEGTLYDSQGFIVIVIVVVIAILVWGYLLINLNLIQLYLDRKNKIKITEEIKIVSIYEIPENSKKMWKTLEKDYTHEIYFSFNDYNIKKEQFNSELNPEFLNASKMILEVAKNSKIIFNTKII